MMRRLDIWTRAIQAHKEGRTYRFSKEELKIVNALDGTSVDAEETVEAAKLRGKCVRIMEFLKKRGQASRQELIRECFENKVLVVKINEALDVLLNGIPTQIEVENTPRPAWQHYGRGTTFYRLIGQPTAEVRSVVPRSDVGA